MFCCTNITTTKRNGCSKIKTFISKKKCLSLCKTRLHSSIGFRLKVILVLGNFTATENVEQKFLKPIQVSVLIGKIIT